jgi:glycosyltransferase involved in cell wall biosynthesis
VITYTGTISETYDVTSLLKALNRLPDQTKNSLLIRFVGKIPSPVADLFRETGIEVELVGYVDHSKSIEYLLRSDLLLLVIPKVINNRGILTGKFFEYLASGKPVLAIGPVDGDLNHIINETRCGQLFDYADDDGIFQYIRKKLEGTDTMVNSEQIEKYARRQLTARIAELLNASNPVS